MSNFAQEYAKLVYDCKPVSLQFHNEQKGIYITLSVDAKGKVFEAFGDHYESRQAIPVYWGQGLSALAKAIETLTDWEKNKR